MISKLNNYSHNCQNLSKKLGDIVVNDLINTSDAFFYSCQRIRDVLSSRQGLIGTGLGASFGYFISPVYDSLYKAFELKIEKDPFSSISSLLSLSPLIVIMAPVIEELIFREKLYNNIEKGTFDYCVSLNLSEPVTWLASKITALFLSSILFGVVHFSNALFFSVHPKFFLPQVIFATVMGFALGLAKEISKDMKMPIGIHLGNNAGAVITGLISPS